jgi:hypothetical protein
MTLQQYIKDNIFIIGLTLALILFWLYLKYKSLKESGYFAKRKELKIQKKLEKQKAKEASKKYPETKEQIKYEAEAPLPQKSVFAKKDLMATLIDQRQSLAAELKSIDAEGTKYFDYEKRLFEDYTGKHTQTKEIQERLRKKYESIEAQLEHITAMIENQKRFDEENKGDIK